ncbi:MAG: 50S ribosomal protein L29 [Chloroflexi bacterium]|nr:50S ribosomal protein L29 [Chloroflexota bacterium]
MKSKELRELNTGELRTKVEEAHRELFNLRFQLASRQLTNYRRLTQVRRDIARIKTLLRERELQEAGIR